MRATAQQPKTPHSTGPVKTEAPLRASLKQKYETDPFIDGSILQLQRLIGNRALGRLLQTDSPRLQRGPLDDQANRLEGEILALSQFTALSPTARADAQWIINEARRRPAGSQPGQRLYYLTKLRLAITTPFDGTPDPSGGYGCTTQNERNNRAEVAEALNIERLMRGFEADLEERVVSSGNLVERTVRGGKKILIDRSDPTWIRIRMKVRLLGAPADVASIRALEDGIERQISGNTQGYWIDIVFVDASDTSDPAFIFEFNTRFCEWANAGNWASGPATLSHELHHALGLDDRYDYIESHADNRDMSVDQRLHWFRVQMGRTVNPRDQYSMMNTGGNPVLAEDACAVAFDPGPDRQRCINARRGLDPATVPPLP